MSRCFPFPPPGYERKARNDGEDLLEKEKLREKKHKKEKKEKEKREGKEKREKDRSDGKHREKKDKKEKHKDRDKDKEKDKEKDKDRDKKKDKEKDGERSNEKDWERSKDRSKASDEKRISRQTESHVGEKLIQREGKPKDNSVDKKFSGQIGGHKAEKLSQNSSLDEESKYVKESGRRNKDQSSGTGNRLENFSGADQKKDEGMFRLVVKDNSNLATGKEKERRTEDRTADVQGTRDGTKAGGNAMVQNNTAIVQTKLEALPRSLDKNVERKIEGNEKTKDRESDDIRGAKSKEKDKEKKSHGKDKDRDKEKKEDREKRKEDKQKKKEEKQKKKEEKEKKKEERAKEKIQLKNTELDKLRTSNKNDIVENHAIKAPQLPKDNNKKNGTPNDVNLKKRKDIETNGVLHAHEILPGKVAKTTSASHPSTQNGRILEPCQASVPASERKEASNNLKVDNKERKKNGIIVPQPSSVSPMKPKSATAVADPTSQQKVADPTSPQKVADPTFQQKVADPIVKASVRPPHPDSKYLSQIHSVPKMEEWSDYDDQDWLFSSDASRPKRPKVEASVVEEIPLVWAEAQQIGSADICALPYVVPY